MTRRAAGEDAAPAIILGHWRPATDAEIDEAARITEADLEHAMRTAHRLATPEFAALLDAKADCAYPAARRPRRKRPARRKPGD